MFFGLARFIGGGRNITVPAANQVLSLDAPTVAFLMESAWARGGAGLLPTVPSVAPLPMSNDFVGVGLSRRYSAIWEHLIYAYMVENTRIYEVFRRVIWEYAHGERLGIPQNDPSHQWLRTTEELFFKDASPFQPFNLVSRVRPDVAATRRNAYYRMFGMDLNHGRDGSSAYPYEKPSTANREFVTTFEEFLREVWRAIENARNTAGTNPTDEQALRDLLLRLRNMLIARRGGTPTSAGLAREEFLAVCLTGWLALTVAFNSSIVRELTASGPSPEERLRLIGERVGLPAHGRSHSYFILAPLLSALLIEIERGDYLVMANIRTLFAPGANPVRDDIASIVFHWSLITGRDMKAARATVSPGTPVATQQSVAGSSSMLVTAGSTGGNGKVPAGSA